MSTFQSTDILIPQNVDMQKWSVIACDQFTSQPEYWEAVEQQVGDAPSTLRCVLPEVYLGGEIADRVKNINASMAEYLASGIFRTLPDSYIYVERTLVNGLIRKGILGAIDLDRYDYSPDATSDIRATERTVVERIPPRKRIRENAPLELPHILLLCDDDEKMLIEPVTDAKDSLPVLYDFDLIADGGHITGRLIDGEAKKKFDAAMEAYAQAAPGKYADLPGVPMLFAVGDGNHSLATAKACYEALKAAHPGEDLSNHPARYAMVELENIHDEAQQFEPIHRVITGTDPEALLAAAQDAICADGGYEVKWYAGGKSGSIFLDPAKGQLEVAILQSFLDDYLASHEGTIDYIHGDDVLTKLALQEGAIGFALPAFAKGKLFRGIIADGVLPRKTFSMGHAQEKRYYLEARKIR